MSSQIYAALLPHIGKLEVVLESQEALVGLYQLVSSMDPQAINMHVWRAHSNKFSSNPERLTD